MHHVKPQTGSADFPSGVRFFTTSAPDRKTANDIFQSHLARFQSHLARFQTHRAPPQTHSPERKRHVGVAGCHRAGLPRQRADDDNDSVVRTRRTTTFGIGGPENSIVRVRYGIGDRVSEAPLRFLGATALTSGATALNSGAASLISGDAALIWETRRLFPERQRTFWEAQRASGDDQRRDCDAL
jgi:hypothetical protein